MKHIVFSLVFFFCIWGVACAQNVRPGWFVVHDLSENDAEFAESQEVAKKDLPPVKKRTKSQQIDIVENDMLPEIMPVQDKERFAANDKDLYVLSKWLKYEFSESSNQNIVVSPLGFYVTSVMLANGVVDDSLLEFSNLFSVLRLAKTNQRLAEYLNKKQDTVLLNVSLWGKMFSTRYQEMMKNQLSAEIWGIQGTTEQINNWVNARTNGIIEKVAPIEKILENKIYVAGVARFSDQLVHPFDEKDSQDAEFNNIDGTKSKIKMMYQASEVEYYSDSTMQAVRLYYASDNYVMILLPREKVDFRQFISGLKPHQLKPKFKQKVWADLLLPKFNIEYSAINSVDFYGLLGVKKIFSEENFDFAKMVSFDDSFSIKDVYLKAKFGMEDTSNISADKKTEIPDEKIQFIANRPFVFVVNNGDFVGTFIKGN